ncbi:type III pantothenate kinase [Pseudidiomarina taiwanensis]|uniref:Type III pantothenate kinase n=1 Tax=Pseudidiomarina taiwanensis TaxID=337250 RepID=A0A432ZM59_9GAMM|nr:type III pantothenate kinase [Pseudidiomarina taiwanensis]RUO78952.1 hypothetical protein CWI83_00020 [Pseudidiomarina taiwanensis]
MTTKLLLDAGNSRIKAALLSSEYQLEPLFNYSYEELEAHPFVLPNNITETLLASVASQTNEAKIRAWLTEAMPIHHVSSETRAFGVTNSYQSPQNLGVDRWLAMIGAYTERQENTLIIDAGTAITVDWLAADGAHLGGWIVPGVSLMQESIVARAPRVFNDLDSAFGRVNELGNSTPDALLNGCANAFVGLVKQALSVSETELDWFDYRIIYLGGSLPLLPAELKRRGESRTDMVLQGLAKYATQAS